MGNCLSLKSNSNAKKTILPSANKTFLLSAIADSKIKITPSSPENDKDKNMLYNN